MKFYVMFLMGICCVSLAQSHDSNGLPILKIEYGKPMKLPFANNGNVVIGNPSCTQEGTIFFEISGISASKAATANLYALKPDGSANQYSLENITGYRSVSWPLRFFVTEKSVAVLVSATVNSNALDLENKQVFLLLVYSEHSLRPNVVRLPVEDEILGVGIFGSGDILITTVGKVDKSAHLYVLDTSGSTIRELRLFDEDFNASQKKAADEHENLLSGLRAGAISFLQVVPYYDNLLLVPTATDQKIIEINESGIARIHTVQLPKGAYLGQVISANAQKWVIMTMMPSKNDKTTMDLKEGQSFDDGPILEINPVSGETMRKIYVSSDYSDVDTVCESNGQFIGIAYDKSNGDLEITRTK